MSGVIVGVNPADKSGANSSLLDIVTGTEMLDASINEWYDNQTIM
jgi:hypothetical protein